MDKDTLDNLNKRQSDTFRREGWFMHLVPASDQIHENYHTHGLTESFGHPDLQITLHIRPEYAQGVLRNAVHHIKQGVRFEAGQTYDGILESVKVGVIAAFESGRPVLRLILPDRDGNLPWEEDCEEIYKSQLDQSVDDILDIDSGLQY